MKQLTFFDLIPEEENKEADLCETCRYLVKGCCSYNEPLGRYCVLGDAYEFKPPEKEKPTVEESDFSEIVEYIEERTGLHFVEDDFSGGAYNDYKCKVNKHLTFILGLGRFYPEVNDGALFIDAGFVFQSKQIPYTGFSGPFDDVDKVVELFNKKKKEYAPPQ